MTSVLGIGNYSRHAYANHWQGIRQGFHCLNVRTIDQVVFQTLDFRDLVGANPWSNEYEPGADQAVADAIRDINPDVVLFGSADSMTERVVQAVEDCGAFSVLWFCDLRDPDAIVGRQTSSVGEPTVAGLDLLIMTNAGLRDAYAESWGISRDNILWVPQGCLKLDAPPEADPYYSADVVFVGSWAHDEYHDLRRRVFGQVEKVTGKAHVSALPLHTAGTMGRDGFVAYNPITDDQKAIVTRRLGSIYASAKVSIGVSDPVAGYHSNRLFLATGHGAFYFCNWFEGIDQLFRIEGKNPEVETFDPFDDAYLERLAWLISDEADRYRDQARKNAFKRAQADHTYERRIELIWGKIWDRL